MPFAGPDRSAEGYVLAGEVGQGGEVSLEGGFSGQVALGQVLALQQEGHGQRPYLADGQDEELGQGGLLMPLLWGELEPVVLKGLELVSKLRACVCLQGLRRLPHYHQGHRGQRLDP